MSTSNNAYLNRVFAALDRTEFVVDGRTAESYSDGMEVLVETFQKYQRNGSNVYFIGNGGSAAIASHMTADFLKNGAVSTVSLYDYPTLTCLGNDYCYDDIFSKQLELHAKKGELLVTISSSGNSENVYRAIGVAKEKSMSIITFSGFRPDNRIRFLGDISVYVPSEEYGIVESIHNLILQQVVDEIMEKV